MNSNQSARSNPSAPTSPQDPHAHRTWSPQSGLAGTRSPIHDRAPPIKLLDPRTGRLVNVKPSRTATSAASLQAGATICSNFLERSGCQSGAYCQFVHVMGKEHLWEPITANVSQQTGCYCPGFKISCYDPQMVRYLGIPSEFVLPTAGSTNFITVFNENGENFKARFQVCKAFFEGGCQEGSLCNDIHTTTRDFSRMISSETHVCDEEALNHYWRLPADVIVRVYQQNSADDYTDFSGDIVLLTNGAQHYLDAYNAEGRNVPRKKMQHCAHFRLKRLCRVGANCKFIHVLAPPDESNPLATGDDDLMEIASQSHTSHPGRLESPRSGCESPTATSELNVIVRERSRGSGYRSPVTIDELGASVTSNGSGTAAATAGIARPRAVMGPGDVAAMMAQRMANSAPSNVAAAPVPPPTAPVPDVHFIAAKSPTLLSRTPTAATPIDTSQPLPPPTCVSPTRQYNPYSVAVTAEAVAAQQQQAAQLLQIQQQQQQQQQQAAQQQQQQYQQQLLVQQQQQQQAPYLSQQTPYPPQQTPYPPQQSPYAPQHQQQSQYNAQPYPANPSWGVPGQPQQQQGHPMPFQPPTIHQQGSIQINMPGVTLPGGYSQAPYPTNPSTFQSYGTVPPATQGLTQPVHPQHVAHQPPYFEAASNLAHTNRQQFPPSQPPFGVPLQQGTVQPLQQPYTAVSTTYPPGNGSFQQQPHHQQQQQYAYPQQTYPQNHSQGSGYRSPGGY